MCYSKKYRASHRETLRAQSKHYDAAHRTQRKIAERERRYKNGGNLMSENTECSQYLGVHVAERVLSKVFKDVVQMPHNNPGYDFICNKGKKIDVKSSCSHKKGRNWTFDIGRNQIADLFLCLTFDNREDLNPLNIWLIPGDIINHLTTASISKSTLSKWDKFKLDIDKVASCCTTLKHGGSEGYCENILMQDNVGGLTTI